MGLLAASIEIIGYLISGADLFSYIRVVISTAGLQRNCDRAVRCSTEINGCSTSRVVRCPCGRDLSYSPQLFSDNIL